MPKETDIRPAGAALYLLPVETRVPLKFGPENLTHVTCARVRLEVVDRAGRRAEGWGETPLSVQWVWPSALPYAERSAALETFTQALADAWAAFGAFAPALVAWLALRLRPAFSQTASLTHSAGVSSPSNAISTQPTDIRPGGRVSS